MRRIIERVVTVVTTTTWKISWENDMSPAQPEANPVSQELPGVLTEPAAPETKEVDGPVTKNPSNNKAIATPA
jgi:hypothetical protein